MGEHPKCHKKDIHVWCDEDKEHWGWKRDEVEGEMEMVKRTNNDDKDCDKKYPYKHCHVSECSPFRFGLSSRAVVVVEWTGRVVLATCDVDVWCLMTRADVDDDFLQGASPRTTARLAPAPAPPRAPAPSQLTSTIRRHRGAGRFGRFHSDGIVCIWDRSWQGRAGREKARGNCKGIVYVIVQHGVVVINLTIAERQTQNTCLECSLLGRGEQTTTREGGFRHSLSRRDDVS